MLFADAAFDVFTGVFDVLNDVRQNVAVVLLFLYSIIRYEIMFVSFRVVLCETSMLLIESAWCYAKPRCYYSSPYGVMRNLDVIIRVHMVLCETSMPLFESVWGYAKP